MAILKRWLFAVKSTGLRYFFVKSISKAHRCVIPEQSLSVTFAEHSIVSMESSVDSNAPVV
jgi:hypothetical protein